MNIFQLLIQEFEFYGQGLNENQLKLWAKNLSDLSPSDVEAALNKLRENPKQTKAPLPAQIRDAVSGYPTADEAFGMLPRDEEDSFVSCEEISVAFGAARQFLMAGDMFSFRNVFVQTYEAELAKSRAAKLKPKWFASLGSDPSRRDDCLKKAVEKGRLSHQAALGYSHTLELPPPTRQQLALAGPNSGLLTSSRTSDDEEMTEEQRQKNLQRVQGLLSSLGKKVPVED